MKAKLLFYLTLFIAVVNITSCEDDEKPKTVPIVNTGTVTDVTTSSATVSGEIDDDGNASITETGIVYSSNVSEPTTADNKVQLTDNESDFSALLEGLSSGTVYHARAYAINSVGTGYGEIIDFTTGNVAPQVSNLTITGTVEVNKPIMAAYAYTDAEGDAEGATTYQWYVATSSAGAGEAAIAGATAKTFVVQDAQNGKFLRVSVTPMATTGTTTGLEVKSTYTGAVGAETVTFTYNGQQVTYGTITSTTTQKKWLDRNLGATRLAQSINDYLAYGDMFQWGRAADGHQLVIRTGPNDADLTGVNGVTSTTAPYETSADDTPETNKFIVIKGSPGDWRVPYNNNLWVGVDGINNPCPAGWRIPTIAEWADEGFTNGTDAFTKLKLTYTGQRSKNSGIVTLSTTHGVYWTSSSREISPGSGTYYSSNLTFNATTSTSDDTAVTNRGMAEGCRCIKN